MQIYLKGIIIPFRSGSTPSGRRRRRSSSGSTFKRGEKFRDLLQRLHMGILNFVFDL